MDIFFDPARVAEAEALVAGAQEPANAGGAVDPDADGWQSGDHHAAHSNGAGDAEEAGDGADTIELMDIVDVVDAGGTIQTEVVEPDETLPVSVVARRTSRGMVITSIVADDPFFLDDEKVVWDWPDALGRVIEEFR
jgi:hypothetical protein